MMMWATTSARPLQGPSACVAVGLLLNRERMDRIFWTRWIGEDGRELRELRDMRDAMAPEQWRRWQPCLRGSARC